MDCPGILLKLLFYEKVLLKINHNLSQTISSLIQLKDSSLKISGIDNIEIYEYGFV